MSESTSSQASTSGGSKKKDTGEQPFAGIQVGRRRRRSGSSEDRAARAAALTAQAEQVAEAGFLGTPASVPGSETPLGEHLDTREQQVLIQQAEVVEPPTEPGPQEVATGEEATEPHPRTQIPPPSSTPEGRPSLNGAQHLDQSVATDSVTSHVGESPHQATDATSATVYSPDTEAPSTKPGEEGQEGAARVKAAEDGSDSGPGDTDKGASPTSSAAESPSDAATGSSQATATSDNSTTPGQQRGPKKSRRPSAASRSSDRSTAKQDGVSEDEMPACHRLVHESFEDSRTNSQTWETIGANMIPPIWSALREQIGVDRRSSGNRELANGHYMNIVLASAPLDMDEIYSLYEELSRKFRGQLPSGRKTTLRVSASSAAKHYEVKELCDEADFARRGLFVHSALMLRFLTQLREAGPLPPIELPPLF